MKQPFGMREYAPAAPGRSDGRRRSRVLLFDLYGTFAVEGDRPGSLRLSAILRLGEDLQVGRSATRAAAMRMVDRGWLAVERRGRESLYGLTGAGRRLIDEGRRRIFGPRPPGWTGSWCLVAVSVPETRREIRDRMRKELAWLGFGSPSPGLYVSPHDHRDLVTRLAAELGAERWLQIYRAGAELPSDPRVLVARSWSDLDGVNLRYRAFLDEITARSAALGSGPIAPADAFRFCFELVSDYRRCLYADPELPPELLPAGWSGTEARVLFHEAHRRHIDAALAYFDAVRSGAARRD